MMQGHNRPPFAPTIPKIRILIKILVSNLYDRYLQGLVQLLLSLFQKVCNCRLG